MGRAGSWEGEGWGKGGRWDWRDWPFLAHSNNTGLCWPTPTILVIAGPLGQHWPTLAHSNTTGGLGEGKETGLERRVGGGVGGQLGGEGWGKGGRQDWREGWVGRVGSWEGEGWGKGGRRDWRDWPSLAHSNNTGLCWPTHTILVVAGPLRQHWPSLAHSTTLAFTGPLDNTRARQHCRYPGYIVIPACRFQVLKVGYTRCTSVFRRQNMATTLIVSTPHICHLSITILHYSMDTRIASG